MKDLLKAFFPTGLLDYFEVMSYEERESQFIFELREKNKVPRGYEQKSLESKGFYKSGNITDFPLRGKRCEYRVYRRKWREKQTGKIVYRDWNIVCKGTRITEEFASFLKELNR